MLGDELQLGLGIQFDSSTLKQLDQILTYVKQIQKKFENWENSTKKPKQNFIDVNAELSKMNLQTAKVTKSIENISKHGKKITQTFQQANGQIVQITRSADGTITRLKTINKTTDNLASSIGNAASKMFLWSSAGFLLFNTIRSIQDGFKTLVSVESEIVNIRKVLPDDADFAPFAKGAQIISQQFGVSLTDTLKAMQSWSRQFKDTNSIIQLTNASMLAAAVTDITLESSYKALSSIIKQFNMDVADSNHVVSTFNELSNNMRVTAEDLAQGLAKTGSAAKLMGVGFDRAAGLIGTLVESTSMSGSQAGTVLSRMFSRIHTDSAISALKEININAFQPMSKTLDELGLRWNNLTKSQQENIAKSLGGMHHYQKLLALFSNYNRVIEATIMSYDSMGSAEKEMQLAMSTYQKKLEQLKAAFQSLAVNMGNNMLPIFKNIIDGFRILITYHDGIIPKLALVAAGIWGLVTAFKALAAVQTITMTGWLGIGAILVTGAAYLVGMSNSSKQATDSLTQLNNSMNIVNTSMTNLSKASERVRQVEYLSEVHEKLNTKLKNIDKSSKDYIDTLNLYKRVQNQINNLGNQYGVKLDKGKSRYEAERDQVSQLIIKLKELEAQKQRMYEKDLQRQIKQNQQVVNSLNQKTYGSSGSDFFDLKNYYYKAWQNMDQEQIKRGRSMTERWIQFNPNFDRDKIHQEVSSFRGDPTGWFKSMSAAYSQAQKNLLDLGIEKTKNDLKGLDLAEMEDWGDPGEKLKDKIQPIFTSLTSETLTSIEKIGRSWQNQINAVLSPDEKLKDDRATYVLKGQDSLLSQSSDINNKMRADLLKPFEDIDKAAKSLKDTLSNIDTQRAKLKATGEYSPQAEVGLQRNIGKAYDDYQIKLQEQYKSLARLGIELDTSSEGFKYLTEEMNKLEEAMKEANDKANAQNDLIKQYNVITGTLDSVADVLDKFGGSVERAAATALRSFSKMTTMIDGKISFDWKNMSKEDQGAMVGGLVGMFGKALGMDDTKSNYTAQGSQMGFQVGGPVGAVFGALIGLAAGSSASRKQFDKAYRAEQLQNYLNKMSGMSYGELNASKSELQTKLAEAKQRNKEILENDDSIVAMGVFDSEYTGTHKINSMGDLIKATQERIKEVMKTLSEGLRSSVNEAFTEGISYMDFVKNLNKSVYESVKDGLIQAFVSSATMKPLYDNLSKLMLEATADGVLSAVEISGIQSASGDIASKLQPLYQALSGLGDSFNIGGSSGSEQSYQAGSSVPIVYNNYITIQSMAFAGNEDEAREFALLLNRYVIAEQGRG